MNVERFLSNGHSDMGTKSRGYYSEETKENPSPSKSETDRENDAIEKKILYYMKKHASNEGAVGPDHSFGAASSPSPMTCRPSVGEVFPSMKDQLRFPHSIYASLSQSPLCSPAGSLSEIISKEKHEEREEYNHISYYFSKKIKFKLLFYKKNKCGKW